MVQEMPDKSWFSVVEEAALRQGDVLFGCPVPILRPLQYPLEEGDVPELSIVDLDLVVLSQSCDLTNDKVEDVLLAEVVNWKVAKEADSYLRSTDGRRAVRRGNLPGYSLLKRHDGPPTIWWSLVDFHRLRVLPKSQLEALALSAGPRLRLESPYREHLAQALARYFMRVGLPHDAAEFEQEGK